MQSNNEDRVYLTNLIYRLGWITLLRRTTDMIKIGIVNVKKSGTNYHFSMTANAKAQFDEKLQFNNWEQLEDKISKDNSDHYKGWSLAEAEMLFSRPNKTRKSHGC